MSAVDAYDAINEQAQISDELLRPIVEALLTPSPLLTNNVTGLLGRLAESYEMARTTVVQMMHHSKSHVRYNAIASLTCEAPADFKLQALSLGFRDKSSRVRTKAYDEAVYRLRFKQAIPEMEAAIALEKNPTVRSNAQNSLAILRDGYVLTPSPESGYNLVAFTRDGHGVRYISESEFQQKSLESFVREMASR